MKSKAIEKNDTVLLKSKSCRMNSLVNYKKFMFLKNLAIKYNVDV